MDNIELKDIKNFKINPFIAKRFGDKTVLFTSFGKWAVISNDEYKNFKRGIVSDELFKSLKYDSIILDSDNEKSLYQFIKNFHWNKGKGPSLHIIVPTLRCNHTCRYCYALRVKEDLKGYDMDIETARKRQYGRH